MLGWPGGIFLLFGYSWENGGNGLGRQWVWTLRPQHAGLVDPPDMFCPENGRCWLVSTFRRDLYAEEFACYCTRKLGVGTPLVQPFVNMMRCGLLAMRGNGKQPYLPRIRATSRPGLDRGSGPDSNCFRLCVPHGLCHNDSAVPIVLKNSRRLSVLEATAESVPYFYEDAFPAVAFLCRFLLVLPPWQENVVSSCGGCAPRGS